MQHVFSYENIPEDRVRLRSESDFYYDDEGRKYDNEHYGSYCRSDGKTAEIAFVLCRGNKPGYRGGDSHAEGCIAVCQHKQYPRQNSQQD